MIIGGASHTPSLVSLLLYLYKLFDKRSVYRQVIVVGFATCFSAALAFGILSVRQVFGMYSNRLL